MVDISSHLSVIITGASRGIGLATARALKAISSEMALIASSLESFTEPIRGEFGSKAKFYAADFASTSEVNRLSQELRKGHHHFDVVINNCGIFHEGPFSDAKLSDLQRMLEVNVTAPISLTRLIIEQIKKGKNSIIINISSVQAEDREKNMAVYAATKSALSAFSDSLRKEFNPVGIRVTVLELASVNTWDAQDTKGLLSPEQVAETIRMIVTQDSNVQVNNITLAGI